MSGFLSHFDDFTISLMHPFQQLLTLTPYVVSIGIPMARFLPPPNNLPRGSWEMLTYTTLLKDGNLKPKLLGEGYFLTFLPRRLAPRGVS